MYLKLLCALLALTFMLACPASALSREELRLSWQQANLLSPGISPYQEIPDAQTFSAGSLTPEAQQHALDCLNFIRKIAGLEDVSIDPLYTLRAQNGAMLLAANDELNHNAPQPEGMDDALYESAHLGTSLGNIAKFNWMRPDILIDGVTYFARDDGDANLSVLGHRRWLLNPLMAKTGFGLANAESGMSYVSMYAVDMGNADADWDYVAWPCAGAFPVEMMRSALAWSVSLNGDVYDLSVSRPQVYIMEESSGAEFRFDPESGSEDGYCTLSNEPYGSGSCIIFRPEIADAGIDEYVQNQVWRVEITGLRYADGSPAEISYVCEMTSLTPQDVVNVELSQLEAQMVPGDVLHLQADVIPAYADDLSITWGSSDPKVASVNAEGMVTAIGPGECQITAMSVNGRKDICEITVE